MNEKQILLVIADLDGTLIDPEKNLTRDAVQAVWELEKAGILFSVVSGRPPFGMRMYVDELQIRLPIAGFNGGEITTPSFSVLSRHTLDPELARELARFFEARKVAYWLYRGSDWMARDPNSPHAVKEAKNVGFNPSVVASFEERWEGLTKIVGISDDPDLLERCEREMHEKFGQRVDAARSQPYYLDVMHPKANKETFVEYFSKNYSIARDRIATIGDMPNDVAMFDKRGLAIAMGNAPDSVKAAANRVTSSNAKEGFALAMRKFVLGKSKQTAA